MIVVADTSPLNYLIRMGRPEILRNLFGRVLIPSAVLTELQHSGAPSAVRSWAESPPSWLEVISCISLDESLPEALDVGERWAISLAVQLRADLLLVDEKSARSQAIERGIRVAGTLAVLLQAALQNELALPEILGELRALGFYMSASVEQGLLEEFERLREDPRD